MLTTEQMGPAMEPGTSSGLDIGQVLKRRKLLLILGLAAGAGLAYLFYIRQPPEYESKSRVLLTQKKSENLPLESAGFAMKSSLANELMKIRSEDLLESALKSDELEKYPTFREGVAALQRGLKVKQIEATDVLEISFRGPHAQDCREAVEAVTETYKKYVEDSKTKSNDDIKDIINKAVGRVRDELAAKETEYEDFQQTSELLLSGGDAINPIAERMNTFYSKLTAAEVEESQINAEIRTIEEARAQGGNHAALQLLVDQLSGGKAEQVASNRSPNDPRPTSLTQELFQLSMQMATARDQYGPRHPKVIELERQITFMKNFLLKQESTVGTGEVSEEQPVDFVTAYLNRLNLQLATLRQEKENLRAMMENESARSKAMRADVVKNENLQASISRLRSVHAELVQRLKDVELVQTVEGRQATVIEEASLARQVGPDFTKIMGIGSVLGLLVGFGLACLIELADKSFRSPDDLMAELHIPVLSHIPFMREAKKRKPANGSNVGNALITVLRPKSRTAEAYRSVRTALYFSTSGEVNKIVQVTSPVAGDGKSTLAANLAVAIAHSGKRVLLLDADLRRPTVHKVFGLPNKQGVSTVVSGSCPLQEATHDTEVENLSVLSCGPRPDNPSEMLLSPEFEQLLEYVRSAFDFVVIDSPPVLAVTDPASVAARADGVIVTLRLAKRSRDLAKRAVDQLQNVGANIIGVVVNGVDSVESYGYRSHGYGGYGYGAYGQGYSGYYGNQSGYYDEGTRQPAAPKRSTALSERTNGRG